MKVATVARPQTPSLCGELNLISQAQQQHLHGLLIGLGRTGVDGSCSATRAGAWVSNTSTHSQSAYPTDPNWRCTSMSARALADRFSLAEHAMRPNVRCCCPAGWVAAAAGGACWKRWYVGVGASAARPGGG